MTINRLAAAVCLALVCLAAAGSQTTLYSVNYDNQLVTIDPQTGDVTVISAINGGSVRINSLAVDPITGILYGGSGRDDGNPCLYTIDRRTAQATLIGSFPDGPMRDLTFNSMGILYGWSNDYRELCRINKANASVTVIGGSGSWIGGLDMDSDGTMYFAEQAWSALYVLSSQTGARVASIP